MFEYFVDKRKLKGDGRDMTGGQIQAQVERELGFNPETHHLWVEAQEGEDQTVKPREWYDLCGPDRLRLYTAPKVING